MRVDEMNKQLEREYRQSRDERLKRIRARGLSPDEAEDVVQETFYRALKYIDTFNPEYSDLNVWLDRIMSNAIKDYKHAKISGDYSFLDELETDENEYELEQFVLNKDQLEAVHSEIGKLPLEERQVVYANLILGHGRLACSKIFDLKLDRINYILRKFKEKMTEKYN